MRGNEAKLPNHTNYVETKELPIIYRKAVRFSTLIEICQDFNSKIIGKINNIEKLKRNIIKYAMLI